jgi:hypothetical protein
MRALTDAARLHRFMRELGRRAQTSGRAYLVGGACAVLMEWRPTTIDIDLDLDPALEPLLREVPALKEELQVNVELASRAHFIPALPGWRARSPFIRREGRIDFHHYDFYAQALAKIERGHDRDLGDVRMMAAAGLVEPAALLEHFEAIVPELYRYPAIDPPSFRHAVEDAVRAIASQD